MKILAFIIITVLFSTEINSQTNTIVKKKFPVTHKFEEFKTLVYKGKKSRPKLKDNQLGRYNRKQLEKRYYTEGVNFGGHYFLAEWGCGNTCNSSAVIDVKTGIVYNGTFSCNQYKFQKNSKMLIVNIPKLDSTGYYEEYNLFPCKESAIGNVYVWSESKKSFIQLKTK
jgi:hypothetical protein